MKTTKKVASVQTKRRPQSGRIARWFMLFPSLFLLVLCSIYPFAWILKYVFYDYNGFKAYYIGLDNITRTFQDEIFWSSVMHTFEYAFLKLLFILPLSLITAVLLQRKRFGSALF